MSFWHPDKLKPKLSDLVVDVDKDWAGHEIKNLKAPTTDSSAGRLYEIKLWSLIFGLFGG